MTIGSNKDLLTAIYDSCGPAPSLDSLQAIEKRIRTAAPGACIADLFEVPGYYDPFAPVAPYAPDMNF